MSVIYSTTPFTVTGQSDIEADAPRSQGMGDQTAQAVVDANDALMSQVLHLHVDLSGYTVTVTVDNALDGTECWVDYGDGHAELLIAPDQGTHDYLTDGVYVVAAYTRTGAPEMAQQEIAVNWPAPVPEEMP